MAPTCSVMCQWTRNLQLAEGTTSRTLSPGWNSQGWADWFIDSGLDSLSLLHVLLDNRCDLSLCPCHSLPYLITIQNGRPPRPPWWCWAGSRFFCPRRAQRGESSGGVSLMARRKSQFLSSSSTTLLSILLRFWVNLLTSLLVWGWYMDVLSCFTCKSQQTSDISFETKGISWSVSRSLGSPTQEKRRAGPVP